MQINNQEEWEAIKKFIESENNVYPAPLNLYKDNKVRIIDVINFLNIFYQRREEVVLDDNFIFKYTTRLLNFNSIIEYHHNSKIELTNLTYDNSQYCFYFKSRIRNTYIKLRRKEDTPLGFQILDATYPVDVVLRFLKDNFATFDAIDNLKEEQKCYRDYDETVSGENYNIDVIEELLNKNKQLIEKIGLEEAKKYWYRLFNKLSTTITLHVNKNIFHALQIEDGEFKIYRQSKDKTIAEKSVLMDDSTWEYFNCEQYKKLMNKYFEMQTINLSDFKDKELEIALKNYLVNLNTLRAKEDDGLDSYWEYLNILKENGSRYAVDSLKEFMRQYQSESIDWGYKEFKENFKVYIKDESKEKPKPKIDTKLSKIIEEIRNPKEEFSIEKYYKDYSSDQKKLLYVMEKMYSDKK